MAKKRVVLADDHALVRAGIRSILEPDYEIAGEVADGRELVRIAMKVRPDVVLVDISMPNFNGLEAIRQLREKGVRAKIIVLTMHSTVDFAVRALRMGVSGYVLKVDASEELARAIEEALAGRLHVTSTIAEDVMEALMEGPESSSEEDELWSKVTAREREVLQLVAEGRKMTEIGQILFISGRTVERHKYSLMDKLKLHSTADLTRYAIKRGLIPPP